MYQGKFESKSVAARNNSRSEAPVSQQFAPIPQLRDSEEEELKKLLGEETPAEPELIMPAMEPAAELPAEAPAVAPEQPKEKKHRGPRRHTVIFYSIYTLCILAFFAGLYFLMGELDGFLVRYEAAQPDAKSKETFEQLFAQPDWSELYHLAEVEDTAFDGKDSFVSYMQAKVGTQQLTFVETSVGLSKDKKYFVRMGEENIGSFSMGNVAGAVAIPEWELSDVEIYTAYDRDVTISSYPGCTVQVNGVALTDEHIIRTTATRAEEYLPEGLHGMRTVTYYLDGLLVAPAVSVLDEKGNPVTLDYDTETNTYSHDIVSTSISAEQKAAFEKATEIYGRFMITDVGKNTLAKYFTGKSYDAIIQAELTFVQTYTGFAFTPAQITEFYAYSDTYCSARVNRTLEVTRKNGTVKEFEINTTYFMEKKDGAWIVVDITNTDVQSGGAQVRLRFMMDGRLLEDQMLESDAQVIIPPEVQVPAGKQIKGWFLETTDENGKKSMTLAFQTNDFGEVFLPAGYVLEPMTVHVLFENKEAK